MQSLRLVLLMGAAVALVSGQQLPVKLDAFKNHPCFRLVEKERGGGITQTLYQECGQSVIHLSPELRRQKGKFLLYACITNKLGLLSNRRFLNTDALRSIIQRSNSISGGEKSNYNNILNQCDSRGRELIMCMDLVCPGLLSPVSG
ncbi:hypothetical protein FJT64_017749 [Amphibalanus amphitrite]|uniref:Uncharacterized protein n=1 Tax=Amphibalanus amphitrite TaxID=1232801 RepID=A0A6A4X1S7_AMPAM|nr:hypothetical protein FJT64_017749 [Amphibalanus amphitrite]